MAVFYNEEGVTEQHEMATAKPGIFLTEIENDKSTHVRFAKNEPENKTVDPQPDPSSDTSSGSASSNASGSAQTGDGTPIALLSIVAVACGAFVLRCKFN